MKGRRMWILYVLGTLVLAAGVVWAMVTQPAPGKAHCEPPEVDPERLKADVRFLSEELPGRAWDDDVALNAAADLISQRLGAHGAAVDELIVDAKYGGVKSRVVIGRFGPETKKVIVVGAHYDTWEGFPGADDNASGVAALLELARHFGKHPPRVRVELVGYPNEEPPHFTTDDMGSAQHARALKQRGAQVVAAISLEMLGTFSDEPDSQQFPLAALKVAYPDTGNFIAVVGQLGHGAIVRKVKRAMRGATDLPVESINAPRFVPGIDFSDHASYWNEGFEAVMITDTAFYRNPRYHTEDDTWDTLDYPRMAKVVQGVYCAVTALAAE